MTEWGKQTDSFISLLPQLDLSKNICSKKILMSFNVSTGPKKDKHLL